MVGKKIRKRITVARKMLGRERPIFVKVPMPRKEARKIARLRRTAVNYPFKVIPVRTSLTPDKMIEITNRTRITARDPSTGKMTYYDVGHRLLANTVLNELKLNEKEKKLLHEFMGSVWGPSELPKTDRRYRPLNYFWVAGVNMIKERGLNRTKELLNQMNELVTGIRHAFATEHNKRRDLATQGKKVVLPVRNDLFSNPAATIQQHCIQFLDALRDPKFATKRGFTIYLEELGLEDYAKVTKFFEQLHGRELE